MARRAEGMPLTDSKETPHLTARLCPVKDQVRLGTARLTKGADDHGGGHVPVGVGSGGRLR